MIYAKYKCDNFLVGCTNYELDLFVIITI